MKTVDTGIPDINLENIELSKVELANKIIRNIHPLFDEVFSDKRRKVEELKKKLAEKKKKVLEEKSRLEFLLKDYNRKKKVMKLLERTSKLVSSGLVYDGRLRSETIVLLKVVDSMDEGKLDQKLSDTMKIITKRFSN